MEKLIITCAITGAELSKDETPVLPVTPDEQARAARECVEAGASIIHLHVRDDQARPSQELAHFKRSVEAIRAACPDTPIIQFSTGGAVGEAMEKRIEPLSLKPEMGSFNTGTINFGDDIFVNSFPDMRGLAAGFKKYGVVPEFEIYDLGHLANLEKLIKEGLVTPPYHIQFVLGVPGAMQGDCFRDLAPLVQRLPQPSTWGVAGVGRFQLPLATVAIATGGHVRVGLEDNIYFSRGVLATGNAQLVSRVADLAKLYGRGIASIQEARQLLGL
ncbi:MAG: 3-keto-5-aminohexanoate cleavage protein [Bdellovibrionales bacterium]|nr:3-keto-5-aminohexanoate cleavage protein [Bdellovibrionales bacterium]